jgi:hypothetical protein
VSDPVFRSAISLAKGSLLQGTNPEVSAYFMLTIAHGGCSTPSLHAGAITREAGDLFRLDMGQPVQDPSTWQAMVALSDLPSANKRSTPLGDIYRPSRALDAPVRTALPRNCAWRELDATSHVAVIRAREDSHRSLWSETSNATRACLLVAAQEH